jgi:hypothetical protein
LDPEVFPYLSRYATLDNNPIRKNDPNGDDWWDKVVGVSIGVVTNVIPFTDFIRDSYSPRESKDYNNTLKAVDYGMMLGGAGTATAGGVVVGASLVGEAFGGAATLSVVGAPIGVPVLVVSSSGLAVGGGMIAGGGYLVAMAGNSKSKGYDRGAQLIE